MRLIFAYFAGAHLALWLAGRNKIPAEHFLYRPNPLKIFGMISLAGTLIFLHPTLFFIFISNNKVVIYSCFI